MPKVFFAASLSSSAFSLPNRPRLALFKIFVSFLVEEQIANLLHETNQYITTITGIGDVLGAIIVSEIGDINRFERPNQLVAFAGLDVTVKQSGEFSGTKNKISKRGSPYLRRAIWLAAQRAAFCDPVFLVCISLLKKFVREKD